MGSVLPIRRQCTAIQFQVLCSMISQRRYDTSIYFDPKIDTWKWETRMNSWCFLIPQDSKQIWKLVKKGWLKFNAPSFKEVRVQCALGLMNGIPFTLSRGLRENLLKELTFNIKSRKVYVKCWRN